MFNFAAETNANNMNDKKNMIKVEYLPCLNYAMTTNGRRCVEYIEVTNPTVEDWTTVTVRISGELVAAQEQVVERIPSGETVRLTNLDVVPDRDKLRELTESVETQFNVE